eukprot:jgi/Botrbrau1/10062/Bobra.0355s0018.1
MVLDNSGESCTLLLLLETHPSLWCDLQRLNVDQSNSGSSLGPATYIEQVIIFLNAFLLINEGNRLAVFAVHNDDSHIIYMSPGLRKSKKESQAASPIPLQQQVVQGLVRLLRNQEPPSSPDEREAVFSAALSRALCLLSRVGARGGAQAGPRSRILCLQHSPDAMPHYIPIMNAIFSAQRSDVVIDTCVVAGPESAFMQQAAHMTGGWYLRPKDPGALLQYLLTVFLADTETRKLLKLPGEESIDFRASCFCHKKAIELGYVCSVCLSVFCQSLPECSTCGTTFTSSRKRKSMSL